MCETLILVEKVNVFPPSCFSLGSLDLYNFLLDLTVTLLLDVYGL